MAITITFAVGWSDERKSGTVERQPAPHERARKAQVDIDYDLLETDYDLQLLAVTPDLSL